MASSFVERMKDLERENQFLKDQLSAIALRGAETSFDNVTAHDMATAAGNALVLASIVTKGQGTGDRTELPLECDIAEVLVALQPEVQKSLPGLPLRLFNMLLLAVGQTIAESL